MSWNWMTSRDFGRVKHEASRATDKADRARDELRDVQEQLDRLTLACAALWSLLKQHGHAEEELIARMQDLDLRDGKPDGRLTPGPLTCAGCQRKAASHRETCLYCGATLPRPGAFGTDV